LQGSTDQLSWNINSPGTKSVEYTLLTAALDVAEELEADLANEAVEVDETIKEEVDEPITEEILSTVLT
jgi:hypothetical protein